jgi:hypothetical protein
MLQGPILLFRMRDMKQTPDGNPTQAAQDQAPGLADARPCPCCGGTGEVSGVVDDLEFTFQCPCSGGSAESVRWLLGRGIPDCLPGDR